MTAEAGGGRGRLDRRAFLRLCGLGAGLGALPACGDGMRGEPGIPVPPGDFTVPPLLEGELVDGVRVFRLQLQPGEVAWVPGSPTATYGVNGDVLGPTLRLVRGEQVRIEVTNTLAEVSTVHWHGMELPARADGGPYQPIAPGATWTSEFAVVQRALTAWYHPHPMHATARQVYMGLAGVLYVEDPAVPSALPSTYGVDDLPIVIQDRRLFADGTHPYSGGATPAMHDMMAGMRGSTLLVNGRITPRAVVPRGWIRLRLLNGSNARIYNLGLSDDRPMRLVATDGGLLAAPVETTRVQLAPGERAEVLVDLGADAVGAEVRLVSYSAEVFDELFVGMMGANLTDALDRATFDVMTLVADADPGPDVAPPTAFAPIARLAEADAIRTRSLVLSMMQGGVYINGAQMTELDVVPAVIDFQIRTGDTELWDVRNTSGMAHPLHVHHTQFQVLDIDGAPPPPALAGWKDTVVIGPGARVRLLIAFRGEGDATMPYLFHCHILEHEDMGMMGRFYVLPA